MKKLLFSVAVMASGLWGLSIVGSTPASAHTVDTYMPLQWVKNSAPYYKIRATFPSNAYYNRIVEVPPVWNNLAQDTEPLHLYGGTTTVTGNADAPCDSTYNGVYWRPLASGNLQEVRTCHGGGIITKFSVSINSNISWYTGEGAAVAGTYDLRGVLTHEFGHANGWGGIHYDGASDYATVCPGSGSDQTMCSAVAGRGSHLQSPGTHDTHTYRGRYIP